MSIYHIFEKAIIEPFSVNVSKDYSIFLKFIDKYLPVGFDGINKNDPLVKNVNAMMKKHNQHFHVGDMVQLKMLFVCDTIKQGLGIKPADYDPSVELELTHPDERERYIAARSKLLKKCAEIINKNDEFVVLSTNLQFRHAEGHYTNFLVQCYVFSVTNPMPAVYGIIIKTDIDWLGPIKHGHHFYLGKDLSFFSLPDKELIQKGCVFTDREYEIIRLIRDGLDSHAIGKKLFISSHTVDTHRRNILKKTNKNTTSELIIDLQEKGFF